VNANNAEVVPVHMMQGPSLLFDNSSGTGCHQRLGPKSRRAVRQEFGKESRERPDVFRDARFFRARPYTSCVPRAE